MIKHLQNIDFASTSKSQPNITISTNLKLKNLDQTKLESRPRMNFIATTKHRQQNNDQTSASKSCLNIIIYAHFASKQVDKVGLLVAEKVDEDLVLHLREGDADGGPTDTIYFFLIFFFFLSSLLSCRDSYSFSQNYFAKTAEEWCSVILCSLQIISQRNVTGSSQFSLNSF